ncbi:hypothetical protein BJX61DRAFT_535094 [Aspergillus egyptiacus]|nr:hypothetical protein BJX61DRAFT_535094 [Aspergillus egyptiacus]
MTTLHPNAEKLIALVQDFLSEVSDLTPGQPLETHLNTHYPPTSPFYQDLRALILSGLTEGWVATSALDGPKYRRSILHPPSPATRYFSITTVYMDSEGDDAYRGQYHLHPYGEINCVVPVDEGAQIRGMNGWMGAGWTAPAPGTHHYPEVRGGRLVAVFFLPAGRISYKAHPGMEQPVVV